LGIDLIEPIDFVQKVYQLMLKDCCMQEQTCCFDDERSRSIIGLD
jgi:hypothetical protein